MVENASPFENNKMLWWTIIIIIHFPYVFPMFSWCFPHVGWPVDTPRLYRAAWQALLALDATSHHPDAGIRWRKGRTWSPMGIFCGENHGDKHETNGTHGTKKKQGRIIYKWGTLHCHVMFDYQTIPMAWLCDKNLYTYTHMELSHGNCLGTMSTKLVIMELYRA